MKGKMTVSHSKFQYYRHNYCLVCMTGLLGCRWHRYQQSTRDNRKRDLFWLAVLILAFLCLTFYFYFWLIAENDYNNLEWHLYKSIKQWIPWYTILLGLSCTAFAYVVIIMLLSLCHVCHGHQLYIHSVHLVLCVLSLAACVAFTILLDNQWHEQWRTVYFSLQVIGPFLHIGTVVIMTALMWIISSSWYKLSRIALQLFWLVVIIVVMVGLYISPLYIFCPCLTSSSKLPPKPQIFAHRGAEGVAPENTVIAFEKGVSYGVYGLESDVRISYDGIPFIMHDSTLRRTTNIVDVFPERADEDCSQFNMSDLQMLNAGNWFIETDPFGTASGLSDTERELYRNQTIPTLTQFLDIARNANMALMFDVRIPPRHHPYFNKTVPIVLGVVRDSGFNTSKLYWLTDGKDEFKVPEPGFKQTYPGMPSLDTLEKANMTSVNVGFNILDPDLIREYRDNNVSVNVWVVDAPWLFSYFWCLGASSITTRRIDWLIPLDHPGWTLAPNSYLIMWVGVDVLSAVIIIVIFVVQRIRMFGTSFSPESISLTSARKARSYRSRTMKEKLLRDGIIDPIDEPEGQGSGVVNHPAAYHMSSLPREPFGGPSAVRVGPLSQPDQKYEVE